MDLALPSLATGAVDRVWYSVDGSSLYAKTASGRIFGTADFEQWRLVTDPKINAPAQVEPSAPTVPEPNFKLASGGTAGRLYGIGLNAYRSDDGGDSWVNLTAYKGACILGLVFLRWRLRRNDPDEVTVASATGVWRSLDGGLSWTGLNDFLPNLPAAHLLALPSGTRGVRLSVANSAAEIEWAPGEKTAWKLVDAAEVERDQNLRSRAIAGVEAFGHRHRNRRRITSTRVIRKGGCACRPTRA